MPHDQGHRFGLVQTFRPYTESDISAIIGIRIHEGNPWVMDRLEKLGSFYDRPPEFILVDFGSPASGAERVRALCGEIGFRYHRIEDHGIFSLAQARNAGALLAETDLLYFTDIDFFPVPNHFTKLAEYATHHRFRYVRDQVAYIPAFHLGQVASEGLWEAPVWDRGGYLERTAAKALESPPGTVADFVVPYSNNFLCTKDFFMMSGGYDPAFRGHGSEDFELMIRIALLTGTVRLPARLNEDRFNPMSPSFFRQRPYAGFRRLGEAMAFRSETAGFKTFHLWHPVLREDPWRAAKDEGRKRLDKALGRYLDSPAGLARVDHLDRGKTAACLCEEPACFAWFLPFRALGWSVKLIDGTDGLAGADMLMLGCAGSAVSGSVLARMKEASAMNIPIVLAMQGPGEDTVEYRDGGGARIGLARCRKRSGDMRDFREMPVTHLEWNGNEIPMNRSADISRIDGASYVNGRLGLGMDTGDHFKNWKGGTLKRFRRSIRRFLKATVKRGGRP